MKNYIYISDRKLDVFYPQVCTRWYERLSLKFGLKVGPASGEISSDLKKPDEHRQAKLQRILAVLDKQRKIGTIDAPKQFFRSTFQLHYVPLDDRVIFIGKDKSVYLALGCSAEHMIGSIKPEDKFIPLEYANSASAFMGAWLADIYERRLAKLNHDVKRKPSNPYIFGSTPKFDPKKDFEAVVAVANQMGNGQTRSYEFVALTIGKSGFRGKSVLIGSPFYLDQLSLT